MLIQTGLTRAAVASRAAQSAPPESREEKPDSLIVDIIRDNPLVGAGTLGPMLYGAYQAYPTIWLHEQGHAQTINLFYKNAHPTVDVFPWKGGLTNHHAQHLSALGEKLGEKTVRTLIAASGTAVDLAVAATSFGVGFKIRKDHPVIGTALMGAGAIMVLSRLGYAMSAVMGGGNLNELASKGHDFAIMAVNGGISPLLSAGVIAATLPVEMGVLSWLENRTEEKAQA